MRIAFIYRGLRLSYGNGIVSQAMTWKKCLESRGHEVVMCSPWDNNEFAKCDAIQLFGYDADLVDSVNLLYKQNKNIFIAPIFDPDYSCMNAKIRSLCTIRPLLLYNRFSALRAIKGQMAGVMVRSRFEADYIIKSFGYTDAQCKLVMLPSGVEPSEERNSEREPYCFHMSFVTDGRKNVKRLIDASVKYGFRLVLAGKIHYEEERRRFMDYIQDKPNVEYLGFISEEEKIRHYRTAKVFALPSLNEGVGLVALEAAAYGCEIVITSLGGPKEYYGDLAEVVNPYSIDEIGSAVSRLIDNEIMHQPMLADYVHAEFSNESVGEKLERIYSGEM